MAHLELRLWFRAEKLDARFFFWALPPPIIEVFFCELEASGWNFVAEGTAVGFNVLDSSIPIGASVYLVERRSFFSRILYNLL